MSDQLPPGMLSTVTGDDPEPEVMDRIRARLEAALDDAGPVAPRHIDQGNEIVVLQLEDKTETDARPRATPRWLMIAAGVLVAVVAIGLVQWLGQHDNTDVSSDGSELAPEDSQAADGGQVAVDVPGVARPLLPGRYTTDRFGVSITFDVPEDAQAWRVVSYDAAGVSLGTTEGFVAFARIGSFFDAEQATDPLTTGLGSIPPNAVDAWIEATGAELVESGDVEIDGRPASYRRIGAPVGAGIDTGLCPEEVEGCLLFGSQSADLIDEFPEPFPPIGMNPDRFWIIELDDFEPLGIWVSAAPTNDGWLGEVQPLLDSIQLGEPGPAVEGGTARVTE